jgi:AcrR family transcriptional regulator
MADRLAAAAVEELREVGYDGLTVRNVARRAAVAPATAYTYFASKDHLVTEAFWRALDASAPSTSPDAAASLAERVGASIADVVKLVTEEPALAAAATTALFADEPDVARLRRRVGQAFHQRFATALGDDADEAVLTTLDLAFSGALVRAGVGEMAYGDLAAQMQTVAEALTRDR